MTNKIDWLNRICKWRSVFAGWQLGTRPKGDAESDAVRDHREGTILLRVEMNALCGLLLKKGVITMEEMLPEMHEEARLLCEMYEKRFPGFEATDYGMDMDSRMVETTKGWRP